MLFPCMMSEYCYILILWLDDNDVRTFLWRLCGACWLCLILIDIYFLLLFIIIVVIMQHKN